ncbi:type II secretion system protein N [Chitiniphilus purpureus]|uniref:Type II secretion system protein N n=1 Tax=Chitiniphilus purpureus TaxID=2981137 RepID=A0ABY6DSQ9_9NEIS|nr:type II secretion system protein N [Chitiniphilus sp. CD1]UXY17057.1 type II secretion system protein N [Chitiniphilus sp. CD1]
MRRRVSRLGWWFGALLLLFALARLPAVLFIGQLPAPWQAGSVEGTLWQGRIGQLGVNGMQLLQDVRWQWQPAALLRGELAWQLSTRHRDQPGQARLVLGAGGARAEAVALQLPAAPLFALDKRLAAIQLGGELRIDAPLLSRTDWNATVVQWLRANAMVTPNANPFGDYRITLGREGSVPTWQIAPLGGTLAIVGNGRLTGTGPQGELTFTPASGQEAQFAPLLNLLGGSGNARTLRLDPGR